MHNLSKTSQGITNLIKKPAAILPQQNRALPGARGPKKDLFWMHLLVPNLMLLQVRVQEQAER
jgi:hypothetical protein